MATTGFKAGFEGSDFTILYQEESVRGTNPDTGGGGGTWNQVALESFSPNAVRDRTRPSTIRADKQGSRGVTTRVACTPQAVVPYTPTGLDSFIAALLNNDQFTTKVCQNSTIFQSLYLIQQGSGADDNFAYPGAWPSGGSLTMATGGFTSFTFDFFASERIALPDSAIVDPIGPPNTESPFDPVTAATGLQWKGSDLTGVTSFTLNIAKDGAEELYEIGLPSGIGIAMGAINVTLDAQVYFATLDLFNDWIAETSGTLQLSLRDNTGTNGYDILMPDATLITFDDPLSGPNPIVATLNYECNANPYTIQFTQIP